jgi:4-hydroxybenzoate polyprenyltransferase
MAYQNTTQTEHRYASPKADSFFAHDLRITFALGALLVAANGHPTLRTLFLVLVCMVLARTAAMLFNRLSDWSIDQKNPRTANRHLLVKKPIVWSLLALSAAGFLIASAAINRLNGFARTCRPVYRFFLFADEAIH